MAAEKELKSEYLQIGTDPESWKVTLKRAIPMLYGMFITRGIHAGLAEELTQKSVFDAVNGRKSFNPDKGSFEQWIVGIAKNNLAMEMRKRDQQKPVEARLIEFLENIETQPLPDELLEQKETAILVQCAMDQLESKERQVLHLKYIDDLTAREISKQMETTEKAVHSLLYRARISLKSRLIKLDPLLKEGYKS